MLRLILRMAFTHIAARKRQTIVAVLGVAIGVGFSIAMAVLMQGGQQDLMENMINNLPHVLVQDEKHSARSQPAEKAFDAVAISGLRALADRRGIVNAVATVTWLQGWVEGRVAPRLSTHSLLRFSGKEIVAEVAGIDPKLEPHISPVAKDFVHGSFATLAANSNNIAMSDMMAKRLGAKLGDTITAASSEGLTRNFTIAALFHPRSWGESGTAYVLLKSAQTLAKRPNAINEIRIKLNDPYRATEIAQQIEKEVPYHARSWQQEAETIESAMAIQDAITYTVAAAILLVASFGIFNVISTITHEKARDIAILKSLGFSETDMRRLFLLEGSFIGGGGAVAGSLIGLGLALLLSSIGIDVGSEDEKIYLPVSWSLAPYLIASLLALGSAAAAGYLPARRAAAQAPVDIIRGAT